MTVLVTGADGYLGWPTVLRLSETIDQRIIGVDNQARRKWVEQSGSKSAIPIQNPQKRFNTKQNISYIQTDLSKKENVDQLLTVYEPETILHLAAQPSAPYSSINGERALYTQKNNISMNINLLHGLKENNLEDTHLIETTTTGIYGCYDDETEILTSEGWKHFRDLEKSDKVATRDKESRKVRFEHPEHIHRYQYDGKMYKQQNQSLDFCVTPNHRIFTQKVYTGKPNDERYVGLKERSVEDVEGKSVVYDTGFEWEGNNPEYFTLPRKDDLDPVDIPIEKWVKFLGWYLAEGYVRQRDDRPNNYKVGLSQNMESKWIPDIEGCIKDVVEELDIYMSKREDNGTYRYDIYNKQLAEYLDQFGRSSNRYIPTEIKQLDKPLLKKFLEEFIKGDGYTRPTDRESYKITTYSKTLADDLQEIALKCGYASVISDRQKYNHYVVGITEKPRVHVNHSRPPTTEKDKKKVSSDGSGYIKNKTDEFIDYTGPVWCVTVPGDGIVFVRRNGKPVWSGNSPTFPIPEGGLNVERKGGEDYVPFPNMAGSWYHNTKSFDGANLRLAVTNWGQPITDIRTAIVYGTQTGETNSYGSPTRFDFDYYFGTVVNRFCAQAVAGYPITVYGKGEQRKPMVSLQDAVESLNQAVQTGYSGDGESVEVYNQVTRPVSIVELAETIQEVGREFGLDPDIEHYENPREEDEEHKMEIENSKFMDLLGGNQRQTLEEGIRDILEDLMEYQGRIEAHEDRFLPGVLTD